LSISEICSQGWNAGLWTKGKLFLHARGVVQDFTSTQFSKNSSDLDFLKYHGVKFDKSGNLENAGKDVKAFRSLSVYVKLQHQNEGEGTKIHARENYHSNTNVYSFVKYINDSDQMGGGGKSFRYGQVRTFITLMVKDNFKSSRTYAFIKRAEKHVRANAVLKEMHGAGPSTFEIYQWYNHANMTRTDYELVEVSKIIGLVRISQFKAIEIFGAVSEKSEIEAASEAEVFVVNQFV